MTMGDRLFDVSAYAYAHRGLWDVALPENSVAAYEAARAAGIGVELDVRLTSDRVPVVFHDAGLQRMCNHRERIDRISSADLSQWPLPDGSTIPTLAHVLDIMSGLPVLIELKVDGEAGPIAECVMALVAERDAPLAVMSFDEPTVARLCRLVRDRPVGLLINADNLVEEDIVGKAATARALGCDYIAPHHSVLETVAEASGGLPLVTWTIRTAEELALARKHGAAPIFETISPALAKPPANPI
jgi:glycerophosphoryl diester phosphodiesterase